MKFFTSLTLALLASVPPLCGSDPATPPHFRDVAFYEVRPLQEAPGKGDRLTPEQWAAVPSSREFFEYWKAEPDPSPLESHLQMAYDDRALYLRITAMEPAMDRLRATVLKRGNPTLWTDDCFELYFDPLARGVSYLVFTINSLGVQNDRKQLDAAVSLTEWRGENWLTWTQREADRWVVEATFPFSDLEAMPRAGDLWMFNAVRYAYTTGKFQGASWSPGGNYASPGNFGYLFFGQPGAATPSLVAGRLEPRAKAPWGVRYQGMLIRSGGEGKPEILPIEAAANQTLDAYQDLLARIAPLATSSPDEATRLSELEAQAKPLRAENVAQATAALRTLRPLFREAHTLYWTLRLKELITTMP